MQQIYTRQAQAFLVPEVGLYNRQPPHQLISFMARMSGFIRNVPMEGRTAAIKMIEAHVHEAWARIHRDMRPYFFTDIDKIVANYPPHNDRTVALPDAGDLEKIHPSLLFCLDVLVDLDRMTMLLHSDPNATDVSEKVLRCWNSLYRATARAEGLENRIRKSI